MSQIGFKGMLRGSAFIFGCRMTGAFAGFATQVLLARWMGAAELGNYVFAFSSLLLISTLCGLGYANAATRFIGEALENGTPGRHRGLVRTGRLIGLLLGVFAGGLLTLYAWLGNGFVDSEHFPAYALAMAAVPIFALLRFSGSVAIQNNWITLSVIPNHVLRPVIFLGGVSIIWYWGLGLNATSAMAVQFAVLGLIAISQTIILNGRLQPVLGDAPPEYELYRWTRTSIPLLTVVMMTTYLPELSVVIISRYLPPADVAVFNACFRVAFLIAFGIAAVDTMLLPRISRMNAAGNREGLQTLVAKGSVLKCLGGVPAFLVLVFFGEEVLGLFGPEFVVGYETLLILAFSQLLIGATGSVNVLLNVTGHQDLCLKIFFWAILLLIGLNVVLVPEMGLLGAACSVLLVVLFWTLWLRRAVVARLGIHPTILAFRRAFT
jgi:O-antigen/teichoic acid export membrane protein